MKTLTLRLSEEVSEELEKIMKLRGNSTASGCVRDLIMIYSAHCRKIDELQDLLAEDGRRICELRSAINVLRFLSSAEVSR